MTLGQKRRRFTRHVAALIAWVTAQGWEVQLEDVKRTREQQRLYVQQGKSRTMQSTHLDGLAVDLSLFIDGVYQTDSVAYAPLGAYWTALDPGNVWGGAWGWDGNHFEYGGV